MAKRDSIIETVAGNTGLGDGTPAVSTWLGDPIGIVVDDAGNLYIADRGSDDDCIRKVDASTGKMSTIVGRGTEGWDGIPNAVALDVAGNLYIANDYDCCIRKVDASTGSISVVAGTAVIDGGFGGDGGSATSAMLDHPEDMAWDTAGNLYIADTGNHRIRKVDASTGIISTVAGTGTEGFGGDGGPATSAMLGGPDGIAFDGAGNLYIADYGNGRIRKVDASTGIISTVAGTGTKGFGGDGGPATSATFADPCRIAFDGAGNLYIADCGNHRIRKMDAATRNILTVAGTGRVGLSGDGGLAPRATLGFPLDVACDNAGNLFVVSNDSIRKVDASTRRISTVAGGLGDGGPATSATISDFTGVACDSAGNLYIADKENDRIRKVDVTTGNISTVAGTGTEGFGGDGGPATSAMLNSPGGVALDGAGSLYIADNDNHRIRKVDAATGNISTVAGTGTEGFGGDGGLATSAMLNSSRGITRGITLDRAGNLYIADQDNHRIRKVDAATGNISTVAGTGAEGFGGDGGPATSAMLSEPGGVALDNAGNLYIADQQNYCVRKVDASTGNISTVPATSLQSVLTDIALDDAGNLYIAEQYYNRIHKVDASTGNISTVAGTGSEGFSGDGDPAVQAMLNEPHGLAVDGAGNIYIAEWHRIRCVRAVDGLSVGTAGTGGFKA